MENIVIVMGVNHGPEQRLLKGAVRDGQKIHGILREIGYPSHEIRLVPEEATAKHIRNLLKSNFEQGASIEKSIFYFAGYCAFLLDEEGQYRSDLALLTPEIQTLDQIKEALTLQEIFQAYLSVNSNALCMIFDLCLLDCELYDYTEDQIQERLEAASWVLGQLERQHELGARALLMSFSKNGEVREREEEGRYTAQVVTALKTMHSSKTLPLCPVMAHQKARYTFIQGNQLEGRVLNEQIFSISRCSLTYKAPQKAVAPPVPIEQEASYEDMMLEELDDFDIHEEVYFKYEIEGHKFKNEADLIQNGLQHKTNWRIRNQAAKLLGEQKVEQAVPILISMIKETNYVVKRTAVEALGQIGTTEAYNVLKKVARAWPIGDPDEATTKIARTAVKRIEGESSGDFGAL